MIKKKQRLDLKRTMVEDNDQRTVQKKRRPAGVCAQRSQREKENESESWNDCAATEETVS